MRVTKPFAIFGFHFSATIFIGLSLYGVVRYLNEGLLQSDSLLVTCLYAAVILASIAGIGFFGREADRRKAEEMRTTPPQAPAKSDKKKKI